MQEENFLSAKPVLKWAGGKRQIVNQLAHYLPRQLIKGDVETYIEPFVGGGAFLFYLAARFCFKNIILLDTNPELIILYKVMQHDSHSLIEGLSQVEGEYSGSDEKDKYYYSLRNEFNYYNKFIDANFYEKDFLRRAVLTVFLNKTCFNGLYRVNRSGAFNVPMGRYKKPLICDPGNIMKVAALLRKAVIVHGDFSAAAEFYDEKSFIYYDPPYRPITKTASFTAYSAEKFDDNEQYRLKKNFDAAHEKGALQMLSNSDSGNCEEDAFFNKLYGGYSINRILAKRMISADGQGRKPVGELVITNYEHEKAL